MTALSPSDRLLAALCHLAGTIDARAGGATGDAPSWTAKLLAAGPEKCAKKLGEEAVETVIAITAGRPGEIASEAADLLYHLFVALRAANVSLDAVSDALESRQGTSGIAEKAARRSD